MKNQDSQCILVKFQPMEALPEDVESFLNDCFEVLVCNYTDDGLEEWVGYASDTFDEARFCALAQKQGVTLPKFNISSLHEADWLTDSVAAFEAVETTDFCICCQTSEPPKTEKITLPVYAATAFGSTHQTTRLCLEGISRLHKRSARHQNILDMGTGTGILAFACAKIWAADKTRVLGVDIDPESVRVALHNALDNKLENCVSVICGDGFNAADVGENKPYDIILANILARPLIEMAPALSQCLAQGGFAVLSGFIDGQVEWVAEAYLKQGLVVSEVLDMDNWHALIMEKKS